MSNLKELDSFFDYMTFWGETIKVKFLEVNSSMQVIRLKINEEEEIDINVDNWIRVKQFGQKIVDIADKHLDN